VVEDPIRSTRRPRPARWRGRRGDRPGAAAVFRDEFDAALDGRVSRWSLFPDAEAVVAQAVREVLACRARR